MSKTLRTVTKTVTPKLCTKWLNKNTNNRPLNNKHVSTLARTMLQGDWNLNGESLKFDKDDNILDGQHRMWGCIEANKSFISLITYNLPREVFNTIDTGRVRGAHDILAMDGEINTVLLTGILKHVGRYYSNSMLSTAKITNKEVEQLLKKYSEVRIYSLLLTRKGYRVKWCAPTVIGTAWYLATQIHKEKADIFFNKLIFGVELELGSPILTLRNKFIDVYATKGQKLSTPERLEMIIITWNAYRDGKSLSRFKLPSLSKESKKFPMFK